MLTVVTVLRSGGIYSPEWVARLRAGVARHLPVEHQFVCLSDVDVPCERIPLEHDWPGWWSKLCLWSPEVGLRGPALYFDLDTLIVGDLSDMAEAAEREPFVMLRDFYRPNGLGSGIMSWNRQNMAVASLYDRFAEDPDGWMRRIGGRGDQGFVEAVSDMAAIKRWQDVCPGQVASYKADRCEVGPPYGARVVAFHGKPKFGDLPPGNWARQAWEALA